MTARSSGYAGRHRDAATPVVEAAPARQSHQLVWLFGGAIAVGLLLFSVVVYPSLTGNNTPQTGGRPATAPTSDRGLQFLGAQEGTGAGTEWPTGTLTASTATSTATSTTSTGDLTSSSATGESGSASAEASTSSARDSTSSSTGPASTSSTPSARTPPPVSSSTPSPPQTTDSPRAVAQALFPEFGFPENEFGCLNAAWNRLGLWTTAAAVRPGLIYVKGRYGTPCAAWDHVRQTGNY